MEIGDMKLEALLPWLSLVILPAIGGLFWLIISTRKELTDYKLDVAKQYATINYLKDVEGRMTRVLERIERKLDGEIHLPAE
ncbi:hypothetical protein [Terasakiella sp.]|uniref:hypothetical protein n=1 Tax=Terasakiella sp. TaxID=2034861 RepID=UPI003AA7E1AA